MALPATYMKLTLVLASLQKDHFYNVFYYTPVTTPSWTSDPMADANTLTADIGNVIHVPVINVLTTNSSVAGIVGQMKKADQFYDVTHNALGNGAVTGDELADFEAVVIQKRTTTAGKSGRGRWYLGPVPETFTDENYIDPTTALGYYNLVAAAWVQSVTSLGVEWKPCLYSKKNAVLQNLTTTNVVTKIGSIGGRKSHSIL